MNERPWLDKYDVGVPLHLDYPAIPLFKLITDAADIYPDRPCTLFKGAVITYKEMDLITNRLASSLSRLGVKKGDRVGIFMPNIPQFVMAYVAILKIGAIVVATNPLYTSREIEHQVNDAGVEVMLVMSSYYKLLKDTQPRTKIRTLVVTNIKETLPLSTGILFTLFVEKKGRHKVKLADGDVWFKDLVKENCPEDYPNVNIGPDDFALLQYSGGTTGISKGAIALHRNLVANALQVRMWIPNAEDGQETVLMAIPLFHVFGMVAGMLFALKAAASMVMVPNPRDMKDIIKNIKKYRPTIYPGVPTMYNALNNHPDVIAGKVDMSSFKACISGSAPLMRETKETFEALSGGKVFEGYGLSEAPTATHCNPLFGENRTGSIGLPMPDVDCRIVNLDDGETILPVGEIGELVINGPQVFYGYHNMPTETTNTLRDGWLYTGDIARMDEDGYFYIVDRKKELIKPGGYQVWPREVEEVIKEHPKVLEVGVAGVPDPHRGETVKAWVVLKPGETMTEDEITEWCRKSLAKFKIPTQLEFRTELPKTLVGKILRRELVRQHKEMEK